MKLQEKFPHTLKFSNSTIKNLIESIEYSRKRSRLYDKNKIGAANNALKIEKISKFVYLLNKGYKFLFIDEVSCVTNIHPNYGYSPKYEKFLV